MDRPGLNSIDSDFSDFDLPTRIKTVNRDFFSNREADGSIGREMDMGRIDGLGNVKMICRRLVQRKEDQEYDEQEKGQVESDSANRVDS
jgi:hypothetical protein